MTDLREQVARAINKDLRNTTCDHPQCSCSYECERHDDAYVEYLSAADAAIAVVVEHCARVAEATYLHGHFYNRMQMELQAKQTAYAIRAAKVTT